jgi:hypothetical protein
MALFNRMLILIAVIMGGERLFPNHPTVADNYDCSAAATEAAILDGLGAFYRPRSGYFAPQAINAATDGKLTVNPDTGLASVLRSGVLFHGWQGAVRAAGIRIEQRRGSLRFSNDGNHDAI